jgi:Flp pilus assembly pilin Flp
MRLLLTHFPVGSRGLRVLARFVSEERGQDLIEYGLLSAGIALVGIITWNNIGIGIAAAYGNWDSGVQNLWLPDDPIGGGS